METFYKVCVILLIIGGVNWGLVGLFSFDAVGWLLGGSASLLSRIVFTVVGVAAVCAIPGLCGAGGNSQTGQNKLFQKIPKKLLHFSGCPAIIIKQSPIRAVSSAGRAPA